MLSSKKRSLKCLGFFMLIMLTVSGLLPIDSITKAFDGGITVYAAETGPYVKYSSSDNTLYFKYGSFTANNIDTWRAVYSDQNQAPWTSDTNIRKNVKKVVIEQSFNQAKLNNMAGLFFHFANCNSKLKHFLDL